MMPGSAGAARPESAASREAGEGDVARRRTLRAELTDLARRAPWWVPVLLIWVASRVVTTGILLSFAARQPENPWTGPSPHYLDFSRLWDGHWYWIIAVTGYPTELPVDDAGRVQENAWAFMPVYPFVVRSIMGLLGGMGSGHFALAAIIVSVLASAAAALLFFRLASRWLTSGTALLATALFCVAPLSPIYQVAYAESLHLALLFGALLLVLDRRWTLVAVIATVMALTRPSGLAFAFMLAMLWMLRFSRDRRGTEPFPVRERVDAALATVIAGFAGLAWAGIAALATGSLTAYTDTELAWRRSYIGDAHLVPFTPWWQGSQWWGERWWGEQGLWVGPVVLLALLGFGAASLALPAMRRMPIELRLWVIAYAAYLLAVFFPQSSTFRLLVPLAPVLGAVALGIASTGSGVLGGRLPPTAARVGRVVLAVTALGLSIAGQVLWVHLGWWFDGSDWTPP